MAVSVAIPPGREALLRAMLCDECNVPAGWRFDSAAVVRSRVRVRYLTDEDAAAILSLEHPNAAPEFDRRTARFGIRVEVAPLDVGVDALLDAVAASIRAHEDQWEWVTARNEVVDAELAALLGGAKPGIRMTVPPHEAEATAERYRSAGAAVAVLDTTLWIRGEDLAVVYAAATGAQAEQLRAVEAAFLGETDAKARQLQSRGHHLRMGELLGYPSCCVEAFCDITEPVDGVADVFRAARAAWSAAPLPRLNDLLLTERASLISFAPCSYECGAAAGVADAIAGAIHASSADALARIERHLVNPLAVAPSGFRALLEIDRDGATPVIRASAPLLRRRGAAPSDEDIALARALVGCSVDATGRTCSDSGEELVVIDFGIRPARE